jgi:hypothetical protein
MRGHGEGNPRHDYVGILYGMIPDARSRQPRDGPMQCGNQPADISVIHRRYKLRASRSRSGENQLRRLTKRDPASYPFALVDK